ncbi:hypothetical protein HYH03_000167 [Edaphochlamys debaryana]|uniref:BACK domain-containing protein n=1 Tax=Edaphochlamys debaryana TaxID=47281 RepID=A0A835YPV4_9CHLO|nr:hypothetical protein HYH03_000167 [Edaphochlamys debaryana]|eukprot:KAG2501664.1 hypothetical protein HYH03_000167 [Edaphochlamys debaryana]
MQHTADVLAFLGAHNDQRELTSCVARYITPAGLAALEAGASALNNAATNHSSVTCDMLLLAQLCAPQHQVLHSTYPHPSPPTDLGRLALQRIALALLGPGPGHLDERSLPLALAATTTAAVLAGRQLCLEALAASVDLSNCFHLLTFAEAVGIAPLRDCAAACCLACMPGGGEGEAAGSPEAEAAAARTAAAACNGFAELSPELLERLLSSDDLQVPSELAVFCALSAWVAAAPQQRSGLCAELVRRCVRLGAMSLPELEALDGHGQVVASLEVTRVVAQAYISSIMGIKVGGKGPRPSVVKAKAAGRNGEAQRRAQAEQVVEMEMDEAMEEEEEEERPAALGPIAGLLAAAVRAH